MSTKEITGTELIRQAVFARGRKGNLAKIARELGIPADLLEGFARGTVQTLSSDVLQRLTVELWGGDIMLDPSIDKLKSAHLVETRTQTAYPPAAVGSGKTYPVGQLIGTGPQPVVRPKKPASTKRAGWA